MRSQTFTREIGTSVTLFSQRKELQRLRAQQTVRAMPMVSQILEYWDQVPNDAKGTITDLAPGLVGAILGLNSAMEDLKQD